MANNTNKLRNTSKLRGSLMRAIKRAEKGDLSAVDGKNLIGLANQITQSLAVELKYKIAGNALGELLVSNDEEGAA